MEDEPEGAEDEDFREFPVKGPASPGQAILAIGFVFFLGVVVGFLLCRAF